MEVDSLDPAVSRDLSAISKLTPDARSRAFAQLLDKLLTTSSPERVEQNLIAYVNTLIGGEISTVSESLSIVGLRPLLDNFTSKLTASDLRYALGSSPQKFRP